MRCPSAPRRPLNPLLLRRVKQCSTPKTLLAVIAGWPNYTDFYEALRRERIRVTPLVVTRLYRVADAVGFPRDEVFLDEGTR